LTLLQAQPFVREAGPEGDGLRLYVDRGDAAMPAILRLLDGAGFHLQTIAMSRPSLDDVFLQQTGHSLRDPEQERAA
jgi:ABC-2 type transport system ATP-binding protein